MPALSDENKKNILVAGENMGLRYHEPDTDFDMLKSSLEDTI